MRRRKRNITILIIAVVIVVAAYLMYVGGSGSAPEPINTTMGNGLQIEDTVVGEGSVAGPGNIVDVHYRGTLDDGTVFDSSFERGVPLTFTLGTGMVIAGWDQGIEGMKVGGKRTLTIPPDLAYGESGTGPIPPNSTLHFDVELMDVRQAQ